MRYLPFRQNSVGIPAHSCSLEQPRARRVGPSAWRIMKRIGWTLPLPLLALHAIAFGNGVSPYLPLNLEPEIESQIERVLILGDKPVMTRPIPAATVLDALPKACKIDAALCARVERFLSRYTHTSGVTEASIEAAGSSGKGANTVDPNRYGMREDSHWDASGQVYYQPTAYILLDAGAVAYEGRTNYSGSLIQSRLRCRAARHPGSAPRLVFAADGQQPADEHRGAHDAIGDPLELQAAHRSQPALRVFPGADVQLEAYRFRQRPDQRQPAAGGLSCGHPACNRMVVGRGVVCCNSAAARWVAIPPRDLFNAFFSPGASQSNNTSKQIGNQEASITSNFLFPGRVPFAIYFEYAGEDTSRGKDYLLGNSALSAGIHFPRVAEHFDLTFEVTESNT